MAKFQKHIFICTNERDFCDERGSCKARGASEVADAFKRKIHACGLKRIVRANKSGCLDQCAHGVTLVVYPEATWYGHVTPADVDEIVEKHVIGGVPVQRLVLAPEQLTGREPDSARPS